MMVAQHAAETVLWPRLSKLMRDYPDITVELVTDEGLTDIVSERFCGRRSSERRMTSSLAGCRSVPKTSLAIAALTCGVSRAEDISPGNSKSAAAASTCADSDFVNVRVERQLAVNSLEFARSAALDGLGLAYLPEDLVEEQIRKKRVMQVLEDWCEPFSGYHLYPPSSRQHPPAFAVEREALRVRG